MLGSEPQNVGHQNAPSHRDDVGVARGGDTEWGDFEDGMNDGLVDINTAQALDNGEMDVGGTACMAGAAQVQVDGLLQLVADGKWEEAARSLPDLSFMTVPYLVHPSGDEVVDFADMGGTGGGGLSLFLSGAVSG